MDDLKVARRVDNESSHSANVAGARIRRCILHNGIAYLEQLLWDVLRLVLLEAHQEARQERRAYNLELLSLRVRKLHAFIKVDLLPHAPIVVLEGEE